MLLLAATYITHLAGVFRHAQCLVKRFPLKDHVAAFFFFFRGSTRIQTQRTLLTVWLL